VDAGLSRRIEVATREGVVLRGESWGDPDRPLVILVHGGGQTRHSWGGTAETLAARGWHAVAYDQRGHGESDRSPSARYTVGTFAADLLEFLGGLGAPPGSAVVVGASLGGLAALLAEGELQPGAFGALVLVDITPRQEAVGVERIVGFMLERAEEGFASLEEVADAIAAYQPHRERPRSLEGLRKNLRLDPDGRWRWHWDPQLFHPDTGLRSSQQSGRMMAAARTLTLPTLLVRGRLSDLVSEETAREFLEVCPHASFVDVSGAGHMVAGDRNDRFTEAVVDFLESLDRAP
jgi:pimeloyl-ACP methyl ester carboxylesterase